jgi:hypothetical protein
LILEGDLEMSSLFGKVRHTIGIGLGEQELYERAFEKGVLLKDFGKAADIFDDASKKAAEHGQQGLAERAAANSLFYRYLATHNPGSLQNLVHLLRGMVEIERIGLRHEMMSTTALCAELECRILEAAITQALNDGLRLRDLHKAASAKFLTIIRNPLLTYEYVKSGNGHDERTDERHFFHEGMFRFYEAILKKDHDPSSAADELALALQAFRRCNDASRIERMETLLNNWRVVRTCWVCQREVQGADLHFSLSRAVLTPYTKNLLEQLNQDPFTINLQEMKVVVCNTCGSLISFRATEEAEHVRQDLLLQLTQAHTRINELELRLQRLEQRPVLR